MLHLLDLVRAYPDDPARKSAMALLEEYRARGAEARRQAEARQRVSAFPAMQLAQARRRLIRLLRARGGLPARPEKSRRSARPSFSTSRHVV
jgi:hypothetical protein